MPIRNSFVFNKLFRLQIYNYNIFFQLLSNEESKRNYDSTFSANYSYKTSSSSYTYQNTSNSYSNSHKGFSNKNAWDYSSGTYGGSSSDHGYYYDAYKRAQDAYHQNPFNSTYSQDFGGFTGESNKTKEEV